MYLKLKEAIKVLDHPSFEVGKLFALALDDLIASSPVTYIPTTWHTHKLTHTIDLA